MSNSCKYYKQQRQVSYDQGQTWQNLNEYRKGALYEVDSQDCQPSNPIYRWQINTATTDYACVGVDKHYKEYYQVSYDEGATWQNVTPSSSRTSSSVIEYNSMDCGYVPPTKYRWVKTDDTLCIETSNEYRLFTKSYPHSIYSDREIPCDASGVLSRSIVQNYYYGRYQGWSHIVIGDCVTEIGENTFKGFWGEQETSYWEYTKVEAKVPPTLHYNSFIIPPIYVPSESLELYKTSPVWENYANQIIGY